MTLKRLRGMTICYSVLLVLFPFPAYAGMERVFSIFEALLPPALGWALFVTLWYLAIAALASRHGRPIGGVPPLPEAVDVLLWMLFLGLTMIGPMAIIYLLLLFPVVTAKAVWGDPETPFSPAVSAGLRRISLVSGLVLAGLIAGTVYIHSHRTQADFLQMLNPSHTLQQSLKQDAS